MFADLAQNSDSFDQRGSSGKTYKDAAEFAQPGSSRKKIDTHNISQLSNFNPFLADAPNEAKGPKFKFPVPGSGPTGSLGKQLKFRPASKQGGMQ